MNEMQPYVLAFASLILGAAVFVGGKVLSRIAFGKRKIHESFEEGRRREVRKSNAIYRYLEPLIDEVATFQGASPQNDQLAHHLKLCPGLPPWTPNEFMATKLSKRS